MRLLHLVLLCAAASGAPDGFSSLDENLPSAQLQQADGKLGETASRLASDLMFAGELADAMMDSGDYGSYPGDVQGGDRAAIRQGIILWIRSHPQEAAQIYEREKRNRPARPEAAPPSSAQTSQPASATGSSMGPYTVKKLKWYLNTNFLNVSRTLIRDAANPSLSNEEASVAMRRLFEGQQIPADKSGAVVLGLREAGSGAVSGGAARGGARSGGEKYEWRLNRAALEKERRSSAFNLEELRGQLRGDKARQAAALSGLKADKLLADQDLMSRALSMEQKGRSVEELLAEQFLAREKLLDRASARQAEFSSYAARFAGRDGLRGGEAASLERLRGASRDALAGAAIAGRIDGLRQEKAAVQAAAAVPAGLPKDMARAYAAAGGQLAGRGAEVEAAYRAVFSMAAANMPAAQVYAALAAAADKDARWRQAAQAWIVMPQFLDRPRLWRSNTLNNALTRVLTGLYPDSGYSRAARGLEAYPQAARAVTAAMSAGDYDKAFSLLSAAVGGRDTAENLAEIAEQYDYCARVVNLTRMTSDVVQSLLFDSPFYRVFSPLMK
ncbi:MAG: hypothetical protein WC421_09235 [Elusimicrobiales bacterium]